MQDISLLLESTAANIIISYVTCKLYRLITAFSILSEIDRFLRHCHIYYYMSPSGIWRAGATGECKYSLCLSSGF